LLSAFLSLEDEDEARERNKNYILEMFVPFSILMLSVIFPVYLG
jgi:hypothetical protein